MSQAIIIFAALPCYMLSVHGTRSCYGRSFVSVLASICVIWSVLRCAEWEVTCP